ncbi:GGDEF domain-containing protein [Fulvimonas yonginensis]|uniref:diguanylate cyclase n=1 Tax=Fulvimonas yonginensis TaxID=1495200 RepID=A0ABU8JCW1_9GAMM
MHPPRPRLRVLLAAWVALAWPAAGQSRPAAPVDRAWILQQAERVKTSDNARFVELLHALEPVRSSLPLRQQWQLRYLEAWQVAYRGDYGKAEPLLDAVARGADDPTLRARAQATLVNILGIGRRYVKAFTLLSQLLEGLPRVREADTRFQVLAEASQFYTDAGQYDLASSYAEQLLAEATTPQEVCKGQFLALHALYRKQAVASLDPFVRGIAQCEAAGEKLFANGVRADLAGIHLRRQEGAQAESLLVGHYDEVLATGYRSFIAQFQSQLAQASLELGKLKPARRYALAAVAASIPGEYTESLVNAYKLLYEMERQQGHAAGALAYHEKYMAADKAYLDDVSAKALAYQMVRQQVQAKKAEVDALARQNKILQLQQALDRKAVEASRLYIAVLLLGLLVIGLWLLRLKRSQLRFMRMAQCDSLTGIYNRKHFMVEAEQALGHAQRTRKSACLLLIDLDHFKLTNDTYGHAVGDQVLRRAVMACQEHVRPSDVFGRLGGEEFGVLLPDCGFDCGVEHAEVLRRAIAALSEDADPGVPVSASFGLACTGESGYDLRQLLVDADHALYRAKRAGRNCVVAGKAGESLVVA